MSAFKPSVLARERKPLRLGRKVKVHSPAPGPAAVKFETQRLPAEEMHFVQALSFESKRAERSRQPFLLMLLQDAEVFGANGGSGLFTVTAALAGVIRETDLCGWYRQNHTLGVIFTEVNPAEVASTVEALKGKVEWALRRFLKAEDVERMEISFHLFPEIPKRDGRAGLGGLGALPGRAQAGWSSA